MSQKQLPSCGRTGRRPVPTQPVVTRVASRAALGWADEDVRPYVVRDASVIKESATGIKTTRASYHIRALQTTEER
jgi:hypothetical protein